MHRPPPIHVEVIRSRWFGRVLGVMLGLDFFVTFTFFWYQPVSPASIAFFVVVLLLAAGVAMHAWMHAPLGQLQWDGNGWHWSDVGGDVPCELRLEMDFQRVLIVSLGQIGGRKKWLWLEETPTRSAWLALRRAIVGSQRVTASDVSSERSLLEQGGR